MTDENPSDDSSDDEQIPDEYVERDDVTVLVDGDGGWEAKSNGEMIDEGRIE